MEEPHGRQISLYSQAIAVAVLDDDQQLAVPPTSNADEAEEWRAMSPRFNAARCEGHAECPCGRTQHMIPDTSTWPESLRNSAGVERPSEMPVQNMSAVTPTEVLRWRYRRKEEANRWSGLIPPAPPVGSSWEQTPESAKLDQMVLDAYGTPVGHWKFFHSRSTTNSAPPNAPPCGREAPQGRVDKRSRVVARSLDEAMRVLETHFCKDLDFAQSVSMSNKTVGPLQAIFREDDAKADYSKTAITKALDVGYREGYARKREGVAAKAAHAEGATEETAALSTLREVQAPAVQLLRIVGTNPTLHTLRLDAKHLGEDALCTLAAALDTNTSLRYLDCSCNFFTPHAAGLLGYSLRKHPLEELYLDFCTIGSSGAFHFGNAIYGNTSLRTLSLRGNDIGPDFPQTILWLLTPLPVSQGGGSFTKKDPNGPAMDNKGARFQCPIQLLRLGDNPIETLPIRLGSISHDIEISFGSARDGSGTAGCTIQQPPPEVVAKGWQAIRSDLMEEFQEYEASHAEQQRQHNHALAHNPVRPPWEHVPDYHGINAADL